MAKVKVPKSSIAMDMTPMVDMAFLLVTFFILTTKFRPDEPLQVVTPSSTSTATVQEKGKITITVSNDNPGRIFFDLDNQNSRRILIQKMGETYGVTFFQGRGECICNRFKYRNAHRKFERFSRLAA